MDHNYPPTPNEIPVAIAECPHCSGLISVAIRGQPPAATAVGTGTAPLKPPNHCPHCHSRIWIVLRAKPPIALPKAALGTALVPRLLLGINRDATTRSSDADPPPVT